MKKISKRKKTLLSKVKNKKEYTFDEALEFLKENSNNKFVESLDVAINLSIDTSKTDQNIRGVVNLPNGSGKKIKVAVITKENNFDLAKKAGADIVGENDLIDTINNGKIDFDILITSPEMMQKVGKLGKVLGPKGLMPNPKLDTVTNNIEKAITNAKSGQVQFKNDKAGIVHAGIGKLNLENEKLKENIKSFYDAILKNKPEKTKGSYIKKVSIASTMGLGLEIKKNDLI